MIVLVGTNADVPNEVGVGEHQEHLYLQERHLKHMGDQYKDSSSNKENGNEFYI